MPRKTIAKPIFPVSFDEHLKYQKGELEFDGIPLTDLVRDFGSPLYVYSKSAIKSGVERFQEAFQGMKIQLCFAVKANSNLSLLHYLSTLGVGTDLVSYGELLRAKMAGVPPEMRVLSGVAKEWDHLREIISATPLEVRALHVESLMELNHIAKIAEEFGQKVEVVLRLNPDVDAKTHDKISTGRKYDKFGLHPNEILHSCHHFGNHPNVFIKGISIHIGSQILKVAPFEKAFRETRKLMNQMEKILKRSLTEVDLGGGIGVRYHREKPIDLRKYRAAVEKVFGTDLQIIFEPGRSLIANAGVLLSKVVFSKIRGNHRTVILDAAMNDLMRPALYDVYHHILPFRKNKAPSKKWDVVGGVCESTDYFAKGRMLSCQGAPAEGIALLSAGAYGFSMANNYNSRPRPAEVWVTEDQRVEVIRKRETFDDLWSHEAIRKSPR